MEDIEGDFWKEIFMHAQHRNMCRIGATRLTYADAGSQIKDFNERHPDLHPQVEDTGSYITWEVPVTDTISLRLFIQNQVKGTLLQNNNGDWVKIADAKFINNPFPEVETILENREKYIQQLGETKKESIHNNMKLKVTSEFIKAYVMKLCPDKNTTWKVEPEEGEMFKVTVYFKDGEKVVHTDAENFASQLRAIF